MAQIEETRAYNEDLIDVIIEELQNEVKKKKAAGLEQKVQGVGDDVNYTGILGNRIRDIELKLYDHHEWSGIPVESYPKVIPSRTNVYVLHQGTLPFGFKGGFAFVDDSSRVWLVAFDYQNNKVYVEAGSAGPIKWDDVKNKLDASTSSQADHKDPVRKGWVSAVISDSSLIATFLVDPTPLGTNNK